MVARRQAASKQNPPRETGEMGFPQRVLFQDFGRYKRRTGWACAGRLRSKRGCPWQSRTARKRDLACRSTPASNLVSGGARRRIAITLPAETALSNTIVHAKSHYRV